jgi:FKBP-type peptidyl-prolyl cis-trans isomerase
MKQFSFIFLLFFATLAFAQTPKPPFIVTDSSKVMNLEGGIKLYVIKEGTGRKPKATDEVTVNYHGRLANGKVFDSSFDRGQSISFPLNRVIKGWTLGFQQMKEGALFVLVIPPAYAYGELSPSPAIPPNSTLIFDCEFISMKGEETASPVPAPKMEVAPKANVEAKTIKPPFAIKDSSKVMTLEGGIKLYVIKEGTGRMPKATDEVTVNYHGRLANGKVFDSSFDRGESISFPLNGVIQGWTIGFQTMKEGALFVLVIPAPYAYGAQSPSPDIPANSTLIFDCEFISINGGGQAEAPAPKEEEQLPPLASPLKTPIKTKALVGKWMITDMKMSEIAAEEAEMVDMMKTALVNEQMVFEFTADGKNITSSKSMPTTRDMKYTVKDNIITISDEKSGKSDTSSIALLNKKELHLNMRINGKVMTLILQKQKAEKAVKK